MSFPSRPTVKPAKDKVRNYFELFHNFNMASVTPSLSSESLQSPQAASEGSNDAGPAQREEISPSMRAKIRALYHIANWPFRKIASVTGIALTTVYRVAKPPITPKRNRVRGRPFLLRTPQREKLIATATESAVNRRKPLTEIAHMAGIVACPVTLRRTMATEGYSRRIARKKPWLSPKNQQV